jgi:hypothetical protein
MATNRRVAAVYRFASFCRPRFAAAVLSFAGVTICAPAAPALAQSYVRGTYESGSDDTSPDVSLDTRLGRRQFPVGAQFGDFSLSPSVQLDEIFNDNIFAAQSGAQSDAITNLTGRTSLNYSKGLNTLDVETWLTGHIYAIHSTEDAWETALHAAFASTVHNDVQLVAKADVQRLVQPRTDPTGLQGLTPTSYELYNINVGSVVGHYDNSLLDLRFGADRTSYDPLQGSQGPIFVNDRNYTEIYGQVDFRHTFGARRGVYVKIRPNTRDYDLKFDQGGFQRSSHGVRIDAGVDWDIDSAVLINAETGYQRQAYDDPRFGTISVPDGRINLSWWPTRLTNVRLSGIHEYYEAFFTPSPGAVRNRFSASIDHELRRRWVASLTVAFERDDLKEESTRYISQSADLALKYSFADGFSAVVDYQFAHQTSAGNQVGTGATTFQGNLVTFTIKKLF